MTYRCPYCDVIHFSKGDLANHIKVNHPFERIPREEDDDDAFLAAVGGAIASALNTASDVSVGLGGDTTSTDTGDFSGGGGDSGGGGASSDW